MLRSRSSTYLFIALATLAVGACSDGGGKKHSDPMGTLSVTVRDGADSTLLAGVRVLVFDANTNQPAADALTTNSSGVASEKVAPGTYYVKLSALHYESSPAAGVSALPLNVVKGQATSTEINLFATGDTSTGSISGKVSDGTAAMAGVLVVATDVGGSVAYSSTSDQSGYYVIYNTPASTYKVKAWDAGYGSNEVDATVVQATATPNIDVTLTAGAGVTVSGAVTFLATNNGEVDVSLVHPLTRDVIPGTLTHTSAQAYSIASVPDGDYIARATFENDSFVLDPDWIVKFGEPTVAVAGVDVVRDFSVTGSVSLSGPTNPAEDTTPVVVDTLTPTFTWVAYPSTSDYVIEVINASGQVIWGGFSNNWATKNIVMPASQLSAVYSFDGLATEPLVDGKTYRWRIYASKDANGNSGGWNLISASEDQRGIFKVVLPVAP